MQEVRPQVNDGSVYLVMTASVKSGCDSLGVVGSLDPIEAANIKELS
jgi:hypothetical protein